MCDCDYCNTTEEQQAAKEEEIHRYHIGDLYAQLVAVLT